MPPAFHNPALRGGRSNLSGRGSGRSGRGLGTRSGTIKKTTSPEKIDAVTTTPLVEKKKQAPTAVVTPDMKEARPLEITKKSEPAAAPQVAKEEEKEEKIQKDATNTHDAPSEPSSFGVYEKVMNLASVYLERDTVEKFATFLGQGWDLFKQSPLADCAKKIKETTFIMVPHCVGTTFTMFFDHVSFLVVAALKFIISISLLMYIAALEFIVHSVIAIKRNIIRALDKIFGPAINSEFQDKASKLLASLAALTAAFAVTLNHFYLVAMHILKPSASVAIQAKKHFEQKLSSQMS